MLPNYFVELLISGVLGLVVWIFRTVTQRQEEAHNEFKKEQEKKWEEHKADQIRRDKYEDDRRREQQEFFVKLIATSQQENGKIIAEIWEELREFKTDRRRYDEEVWKQINAIKDRQSAFELQQAKAYHTKPEFDQILLEKLQPLKDALNDIQRQIGNRRNQS